MRYLAIDYGSRHTGLAVCDRNETLCSPLDVLDSTKGLTGKIAEMVKTEQIGAVVVGLPVNMDGSYGPQAQLVVKFATKLKQHLDIPVHLQDERLSSFAADEKFTGIDLNKKQKQKRLDAVAAAQILETFLESKKKNQTTDLPR
jgi:putative Holliday junction resolvase